MTTSTEREDRRKAEQGYDPNTPRCGTCIYFTIGSHSERALAAKRGRGFTHLQRCKFGDFQTLPIGLCDEWRTRDGERLHRPDEEEAA